MLKTKESKGITLIALIITIIVLLILAGVTINALSGNDSTPAKAQEATQKTDISSAKEDCILTATTAKTDALHETYVANNANKTIAQSVIDELIKKNNTNIGSASITVASDGTVIISTTGYEVIGTVDENGTLTFGEVESLVPGIKDVPDTLSMDTGTTKTINARLKGISGTITWTSSDDSIATVSNGVITAANTLTVNGQPANTATVTITATLGEYSESCRVTVNKVVIPQVGDKVNYSPSGTYNWDCNLAESGSAAATTTNTLSSASGQTYNVTQWKILSYDQNTKMVEMVPIAPKGSLRLQGAQGYNNAVYLLDNACSSLYGNSTKGITARSIKEEDFVKAGKQSQEGDSETTNDWTRARANFNNTNVNKKYGEQTTAYTSSKNYPSIYANEYGSVINGTENTETTALRESEQSSSIGKTDNGATNGYLNASISIQPKQTYYNTSNYNTTAGLLKDGKAAVLLRNTSSTNYWVASRCVSLGSNFCNFSVRNVSSGYLDACYVFNSGTGTDRSSRALFPVVSLSSELLDLKSTNNGVQTFDVK